MQKHAICGIGWALMLGAMTAPAAACDAVAVAPTGTNSQVLEVALQRLKQEQRLSLRRQSAVRLAELRSEAASALAQGAVTGDFSIGKAAP